MLLLIAAAVALLVLPARPSQPAPLAEPEPDETAIEDAALAVEAG